MKKLKAVGRAAGVALCASVMVAAGSGIANASAKSAGWDHVGTSTFKHRDTDLHLWFTSYVHSTGGSFMACVDKTQFKETVALWEHDASNSRKVASKTTSGGCLTFNNIGDYVDGNNNKAEFMVSTTDAEGGGTVLYYD
ncbi:hypothetical protein [Streptomyces sp. BA2]|uniref:hypothetical protein n=1 Tax=Streptomyces sp. BA2 TaxID=436595 RepID=UPI00132ACC2E|nr:hypothetical protein [Streptomyces sp. BA2]MWA11353.1 hypothetical protein [Streptomyces sp. BA2]